MKTVIAHIEYLTAHHDCVVVPGLGAFIASYRAARISEDGFSILPPARELTFNGALVHNDGLLASSIARKESIHYDEALTLMNQSIACLRSCLDLDGEVALGRVGRLLKNSVDGTVIFENSVGESSDEFAWLPSIAVKQLNDLTVDDSQSSRVIDTDVRPYSSLRAVLRAVASIAVILVLALCLTTPVKVEDVALASMGVSSVKPQASLVENRNNDIILLGRIEGNMGIEVADTSARSAYKSSLDADANDYFVIVASLPGEKSATEYIACANKNYSYRYLSGDGRCRVYIASVPTQAAAFSYINNHDIVRDFPDAWVYRRH